MAEYRRRKKLVGKEAGYIQLEIIGPGVDCMFRVKVMQKGDSFTLAIPSKAPVSVPENWCQQKVQCNARLNGAILLPSGCAADMSISQLTTHKKLAELIIQALRDQEISYGSFDKIS